MAEGPSAAEAQEQPSGGEALAGKVVLVSGGTQGLGAAVARAAARAGATVAITGRRSEVGEAFAAELTEETGREVFFTPADVGDVAQATLAVRRTVDRFGQVDCLVNVAGYTDRGSLVDTTPELFDRHIAVNLKAPFFLMQAVVTDLRRRQEPGSIVNVISMSSHGGQPYLAPYVAAKAGLAGLTRNVAHAHRWDRIRVNGLNIGWTRTPTEDVVQRRFHDADDDWAEQAAGSQPMGRLGDPDEIADAVVFLLSDRSGVVTGSVIDWDQQVRGGYD
jgi:NAD(P)-dependent dehydrogenase (short-subunit alcohol dehydrogenase family)